MCAIVVLIPHLSYLILNELTLFYFDLSAPKTSQTVKVQSWTAQVAKANKKSNTPQASTATSTTVIHMDCTTTSSSTVVSQTATTKKKAKTKPEIVNLCFSEILDDDKSAERKVALTSPFKGKKRLTTKVPYNS